MEQELQQAWLRLQESLSVHRGVGALATVLYLALAAGLGLYLRAFFRRFSLSSTDAESVTRVFPLLMMITTGVIGIVKSSLAMSLGVVGALSIIRFRSAIKEPEELIYLFLCVAVGLALGAELPLLAVLLVLCATGCAWLIHRLGRRGGHSLLLTITGDRDDFGDENGGVFAAIDDLAVPYALQRVELEGDRGQLRVILRRTDPRSTAGLLTQLRRRLPDCELSYVDLNSSP